MRLWNFGTRFGRRKINLEKNIMLSAVVTLHAMPRALQEELVLM
jgi:hypothetical protein